MTTLTNDGIITITLHKNYAYLCKKAIEKSLEWLLNGLEFTIAVLLSLLL